MSNKKTIMKNKGKMSRELDNLDGYIKQEKLPSKNKIRIS